MNKFTLILCLSLLSLIWPLSILQAGNCCSGNRNLDFGGNIQPFEIAAVDEIVPVDGFTLKVNRVKWSIQTTGEKSVSTKSVAAVFKDENTTILAIRMPSLPCEVTLRDFACANTPSFPCLNMHVENIRTTFAVAGVKASYGGRPNFLNQNIQLVRYYFQEKSGRVLCFEVFPTKKFANWSDANQLILNTLKYNRTSS